MSKSIFFFRLKLCLSRFLTSVGRTSGVCSTWRKRSWIQFSSLCSVLSSCLWAWTGPGSCCTDRPGLERLCSPKRWPQSALWRSSGRSEEIMISFSELIYDLCGISFYSFWFLFIGSFSPFPFILRFLSLIASCFCVSVSKVQSSSTCTWVRVKKTSEKVRVSL